MSARALACSGVPFHVSRKASISGGLVAGSVTPTLPFSNAYLHNLKNALLLRFGHRSSTLETVACETPLPIAIDTCDKFMAFNAAFNRSHLPLRVSSMSARITAYLHRHQVKLMVSA